MPTENDNLSLEQPVVSAIIVSYNTRAMTIDCLKALYGDLKEVAAEIIVVDNASTDGSVEAIRQQFPEIIVIANSHNAGFGAANNQAMEIARGKYFLLLNSDAFVHSHAIPTMIAELSKDTDIVAVGPRLLNKDGSLQRSCYRFPSPSQAWLENTWISVLLSRFPQTEDYSHWKHDYIREVDWIIGACLLVKRDIYERIGGFDEKFHMYVEETDWQKRMRAVGGKISFTPDAVVTHLGGASGSNEKARIKQTTFESLDYYEYKHHGLAGLIALRSAMVFGCGIRAIGWKVVQVIRPKSRERASSKAHLSAWLFMRQLTHWRLGFLKKNT